MSDNKKQVTAAVLVIGDEILSGRTKDSNIAHIATTLGEIGISVKEARVVADDQHAIVGAVNALRASYDYVFTTGGIGPTHDDITADCIAAAFGVRIGPHPEARRRLEAHYAASEIEFNAARQRMTRIPEGASLIDNPVSAAPGFTIGNVHVMAGIPKIMQAMLDGLLPRLEGGERIQSVTITGNVPEGTIADKMEALQAAHKGVSIGLYPYYAAGQAGVSVVLRGVDSVVLGEIASAVKEHILAIGGSLVERPQG
jgi:molybdenum cofactor synthesis domain-containing protein